MYKVNKGCKVKNVKEGNKIRHFYAGEILPADYIPPISYIEQKIVIEIKGAKRGNR
jgi:hypothetical protein